MTKVVIWIDFECTKFVHVSTLVFLDSKVFYMFWGLHRLQICYFRTTRAKDMNYLVLKCNLHHLNFTSINCAVTMWYYCIFGFYTFVGFQWHIIFYFWIHKAKDMKFQSLGTILFLILIRNPILQGAGHVAQFYWFILFRPDHRCGPFDLKWIGRSSLAHTDLGIASNQSLLF
jgi:hypothetical protein